MIKTMVALGVGTLAVVGPTATFAQQPGSRQSREYVQQSAQSDQFEILEGTTALAESSNPQVRAFAQRMIRDHSATSQALRAAATQAGMEPPVMQLGNDQSQMLSALQSLRGQDFDRAFARQQTMAHHAALVIQQGYAARGDQPGLRQTAVTNTPLIAGHLGMANSLQASLGGQ